MSPDALDALPLEELLQLQIESATLTRQTVEVTPSVVSVLPGSFLDGMGAPTLPSALQALPGMTVLGTASGERILAVRGVSTPANLLVTLDGQRLNDFYDGTFIEDLQLLGLDRVELIRGPGSALYGTNAFAGVISLYTARPEDGAQLAARGDLHPHDALGTGGTALGRFSQTLGRWRVRGLGSFHTTTGPRVRVERDITEGLSYSKVPGLTRSFRRVGLANLAAELQGVFGQDDVLEVWGTALFRRRGPTFGVNNVFTPDSRLERSSLLSYLEYRAPLPHGFGLRARFSLDRHAAADRIQDVPDGYFYDDNGNMRIDPGELFPEGKLRVTEHTGYRAATRLLLSHETDRLPFGQSNNLLLGTELEANWLPGFDYRQNHRNGLYQGGALENFDALPLTQRGARRQILAAFLQDQLQLTGDLSFVAGLRYDHYSDFGSTLNPRLAAVWRLSDQLIVKGMYGRAFRAPTFRELYDSTGVSEANLPILGNPDLEPEVTQTLEGSVDVAVTSFAKVRGALFHTQTDDVIDYAMVYSVSGNAVINYPGKRIWGAEGELQLHADAETYLLANVSWFSSTQLGQGIAGWETLNDRRFVNTTITDLPSLRANLHGRARLGPHLRASAGYAFVSESRSNSRFVFEGLYRYFQRPAFHELQGALQLPLHGERVELSLRGVKTFGETLPVRLLQSLYQLPAEKAQVSLEAQVRF